jgi:hypothetical protein
MEVYRLGTLLYRLGTEVYRLGTLLYHLGMEVYRLGTLLYHLGTEVYRLGKKLSLFPLQGKGLGITLASGIFNYEFSIFNSSNHLAKANLNYGRFFSRQTSNV